VADNNNNYSYITQAEVPVVKTSSLEGRGSVISGMLEGSNVDLTNQLVDMITAQRNYQANAKGVSASDALTQTIINLR
jgi:flagellar hook protein FlgE